MTDLSKLTDAELFDLYKSVREEIFEKRMNTEYTPLSAKDLDEIMEQEREKEREKAIIIAKANNQTSFFSGFSQLVGAYGLDAIRNHVEFLDKCLYES